MRHRVTIEPLTQADILFHREHAYWERLPRGPVPLLPPPTSFTHRAESERRRIQGEVNTKAVLKWFAWRAQNVGIVLDDTPGSLLHQWIFAHDMPWDKALVTLAVMIELGQVYMRYGKHHHPPTPDVIYLGGKIAVAEAEPVQLALFAA